MGNGAHSSLITRTTRHSSGGFRALKSFQLNESGDNPYHICFAGPPGAGKSTLIKQMKFSEINCIKPEKMKEAVRHRRKLAVKYFLQIFNTMLENEVIGHNDDQETDVLLTMTEDLEAIENGECLLESKADIARVGETLQFLAKHPMFVEHAQKSMTDMLNVVQCGNLSPALLKSLFSDDYFLNWEDYLSLYDREGEGSEECVVKYGTAYKMEEVRGQKHHTHHTLKEVVTRSDAIVVVVSVLDFIGNGTTVLKYNREILHEYFQTTIPYIEGKSKNVPFYFFLNKVDLCSSPKKTSPTKLQIHQGEVSSSLREKQNTGAGDDGRLLLGEELSNMLEKLYREIKNHLLDVARLKSPEAVKNLQLDYRGLSAIDKNCLPSLDFILQDLKKRDKFASERASFIKKRTASTYKSKGSSLKSTITSP